MIEGCLSQIGIRGEIFEGSQEFDSLHTLFYSLVEMTVAKTRIAKNTVIITVHSTVLELFLIL